jgi:hypothetical protein
LCNKYRGINKDIMDDQILQATDRRMSASLPHELSVESSAHRINSMLPLQLGTFQVRRLTWEDFKGRPNPREKWAAHIFWKISYEVDEKLRTVGARVELLGGSWVKP